VGRQHGGVTFQHLALEEETTTLEMAGTDYQVIWRYVMEEGTHHPRWFFALVCK